MAEPNLGPRLDLARFAPVNHLWPELVPLEQLRLQTGLVGAGERLVLLLSQRSGCLQLLSSG